MGLKALTIRWAAPAEIDFNALLSYIAYENPEAANKLFAKVMEAIEHAASFPEKARHIPELGHTYRELVSVRPFRVIYRILQKEIWVIGVMRIEQDFNPERFVVN
jgi:plasmid stabilization system protein ParE